MNNPKHKQELLDFLEKNPKEIALTKFYDGVCGNLMESAFATVFFPVWLFEKVAENEEGEDYYEVYTIYSVSYKGYNPTTRKTYPNGMGKPGVDEPNSEYVAPFHLKFYGYHRSHEGPTHQGFKEVKPTTKTVEVFE